MTEFPKKMSKEEESKYFRDIVARLSKEELRVMKNDVFRNMNLNEDGTEKMTIDKAKYETKIDLKEFKRQKELVIKQATKDIAAKIKQVEELLTEINELSELSGIKTSFTYTNDDSDNMNWKSSNCY